MDEQGFSVVGYGCTTCIGNSGELHEDVSNAITENGEFDNQYLDEKIT